MVLSLYLPYIMLFMYEYLIPDNTQIHSAYQFSEAYIKNSGHRELRRLPARCTLKSRRSAPGRVASTPRKTHPIRMDAATLFRVSDSRLKRQRRMSIDV
jgi:hypothetical protein